MPFIQTVRDLRAEADVVRRRRYGVIRVVEGAFDGVQLRPWPKLFAPSDLWPSALHWARRPSGDLCWLYYNQPWRHARFLALKYIISSRGASFRTFRTSLLVLDEIARLKGSDAIVAEVRNLRISDRLLSRWGWESHFPTSHRRHFIKRFYGTFR